MKKDEIDCDNNKLMLRTGIITASAAMITVFVLHFHYEFGFWYALKSALLAGLAATVITLLATLANPR